MDNYAGDWKWKPDKEEINPAWVVIDIQDRHMESTGDYHPVVHASRGFRRLARQWLDKQHFQPDPENAILGRDEMALAGHLVRFDIPSDEVLVAIV